MRLDKMWFLRCQSDANIYLLTFAFSLENHEISQQKEVTYNDFDQWFYQSSQICLKLRMQGNLCISCASHQNQHSDLFFKLFL